MGAINVFADLPKAAVKPTPRPLWFLACGTLYAGGLWCPTDLTDIVNLRELCLRSGGLVQPQDRSEIGRILLPSVIFLLLFITLCRFIMIVRVFHQHFLLNGIYVTETIT
mgnify:CR=1 FL=1